MKPGDVVVLQSQYPFANLTDEDGCARWDDAVVRPGEWMLLIEEKTSGYIRLAKVFHAFTGNVGHVRLNWLSCKVTR